MEFRIAMLYILLFITTTNAQQTPSLVPSPTLQAETTILAPPAAPIPSTSIPAPIQIPEIPTIPTVAESIEPSPAISIPSIPTLTPPTPSNASIPSPFPSASTAIVESTPTPPSPSNASISSSPLPTTSTQSNPSPTPTNTTSSKLLLTLTNPPPAGYTPLLPYLTSTPQTPTYLPPFQPPLQTQYLLYIPSPTLSLTLPPTAPFTPNSTLKITILLVEFINKYCEGGRVITVDIGGEVEEVDVGEKGGCGSIVRVESSGVVGEGLKINVGAEKGDVAVVGVEVMEEVGGDDEVVEKEKKNGVVGEFGDEGIVVDAGVKDVGLISGGSAAGTYLVMDGDQNVRALFKGHRWGNRIKYGFRYVGEGGDEGKNKGRKEVFTVRLWFMETYIGLCGEGKRVFDVFLNEKLVVEDLDVFKEVGCRKQLRRDFKIEVRSGDVVEVEFVGKVENAMVSAIQIASGGVVPAWSEVTTVNSPMMRHETSYVKFDNYFYLLGGRGIKPVERYDPVSKAWTQLKPTPIEIHHFQAVAWQDRIIIVCAWTGLYPTERTIPNVLYYFPRNDTWITGPRIPEERARGSTAVVNYYDYIFIAAGTVGGHGGAANTTVMFDVFDPRSGGWWTLADTPRKRDHTHGVVVGDLLILMGGRDGGADGDFFSAVVNEVDIYQFRTGEWTTANETLKYGRGAPVIGAISGGVVIAGGEGTAEGQEDGVFPSTELFDVERQRFVDVGQSNMVAPRHGSQGIVCNGALYVTAGAHSKGGVYEINSTEVFTFDGGAPRPCT